MENELELQHVIYQILLTQIRFGTYRYGESLPTMEEAGEQLLVSVGPVRSAYRRLKQEGYITLSKNVGAAVKVRYSEEEMERNIQMFFGPRKSALTDLSNSMLPLFGQIQWLGMKHTSPDKLRDMELLLKKEILAPYAVFQQLQQRYGALGNDLLLRLFWQIYMFFQTPFFSIPENARSSETLSNYMPNALRFCREQDWAGLQRWISRLYDSLSASLGRFYAERIAPPPPGEGIPLVCSFYQKPMQICYSLATEIMAAISSGTYPPGTLLPTIEELAREKGISVSTVRRTYALLSGNGAIKSTPRVGTRALSFDESAENCDFTSQATRKRIMIYVQSLQILALSCRAVSELTLGTLDPGQLNRWKGQFLELKRIGRPDIILNVTFGFLCRHAPYQAIRMIYQGLLQQLIWGHPLYSIHRTENIIESLYRPCLDHLLECFEHPRTGRFGAVLEEAMLSELRFTLQQLVRLGVHEAEHILTPQPGESWYAPDWRGTRAN